MRSHRKRRLGLIVLALFIVFVLFEVVVRVIPPDQAQIVDTDDTGAVVASRAITDARTIAHQRFLVDGYPNWQANLLTQCSSVIMPDDDVTIRFYWHGLLLESATSNMSFCGDAHTVSSGGLLTPVRYAGAITMQGVVLQL
ncbi:MAG: hypothetical protein ACHQ1E_07500 [Ktedonobacterales bacterium]|jgi:hypothetical protein